AVGVGRDSATSHWAVSSTAPAQAEPRPEPCSSARYLSLRHSGAPLPNRHRKSRAWAAKARAGLLPEAGVVRTSAAPRRIRHGHVSKSIILLKYLNKALNVFANMPDDRACGRR